MQQAAARMKSAGKEMATLLVAASAAFLPWQRLSGGFSFPPRVQDALTIFMGIMLEALPFVLLGVLVSALIRRYVSPDRMRRLVPKHPVLAFPAAALLGMLFPVCECGNLPVARQLMRQGLRPALGVTFMLAAPILNPAVIISTIAAFRFMPSLIMARLVVGFLVALAVGGYFSFRGDADILKEEAEAEACAHAHTGLTGLSDELFEMVSTLAVGASVAAIIQVVVPRALLLGLGSNPVSSIAIMMVLALVVSLCSNVDAFFALSFANTFSASSLLAFLAFGPMVDFRSLALMTRSFKPKAIATMTLLVAEGVFIAALLLHHGGVL